MDPSSGKSIVNRLLICSGLQVKPADVVYVVIPQVRR